MSNISRPHIYLQPVNRHTMLLLLIFNLQYALMASKELLLQLLDLFSTTINSLIDVSNLIHQHGPNVTRMDNAGLQHRVEGLVGLSDELDTPIEEFGRIRVRLDTRQLAPRYPTRSLDEVPKT
jgi:hypothetical protein